MNEVIKNIKERRSVRFFQTKRIQKEVLTAIIEAGNEAPTGAGVQPWRFVVLESDDLRKSIAQNAKPVYLNFMKNAEAGFKKVRDEIDGVLEDSIYYAAPVIIFVIGKKLVTYDKDCPMVCENMMLAARSLDIGSCWLGFGQMGLTEEIKKVMELQDNEVIFGPIAFGYPSKGFPEMPPKREPQVIWL